MSELDDIRDWYEIRDNVRNAVNRLEECAYCRRITDCMKAVPIQEHILVSPSPEAFWVCEQCFEENDLTVST